MLWDGEMDKSFAEAVRILSAAPSFAGLDQKTLEDLAKAATRREFEAGQVVFLEGDPCDGLFVVERGWFKSVKISPLGREQVIRFVGPGEVFNDLAVFAGGQNRVTVEALESAAAWIIERERFAALLESNPKLSRVVIQNLSQRVMHLIRLVEDLSLRSVQSRLARFLCERERGAFVQRKQWSTQAEMAAHLGTVPDVLNRALRSLSEDGLIEIDRHNIKVLNRHGLEEKAMLVEK